jgi:hypothetical protein
MHGATIKTLIRGTAVRSLKLTIHPIIAKVKNEWSHTILCVVNMYLTFCLNLKFKPVRVLLDELPRNF